MHFLFVQVSGIHIRPLMLSRLAVRPIRRALPAIPDSKKLTSALVTTEAQHLLS
jgi:hypothetical protein